MRRLFYQVVFSVGGWIVSTFGVSVSYRWLGLTDREFWHYYAGWDLEE